MRDTKAIANAGPRQGLHNEMQVSVSKPPTPSSIDWLAGQYYESVCFPLQRQKISLIGFISLSPFFLTSALNVEGGIQWLSFEMW